MLSSLFSETMVTRKEETEGDERAQRQRKGFQTRGYLKLEAHGQRKQHLAGSPGTCLDTAVS